MTEDRIERALRDSEFTNEAHKNSLRKTLFGSAEELSPDELEMAAGGISTEACDSLLKKILCK